MPQIISAEKAALLVPDNQWLGASGYIHANMPESLFKALEERFLKTGFPQNIKAISVTSLGDRYNSGWNHLAYPKLLNNIICSHFGFIPKITALIKEKKIAAHNWPQGVIAHWLRAVAANTPGVITKVGLNTFVDPRQEGGRLNSLAEKDLVKVIDFNNEEWLWYKKWPLKTAFLRASVADEKGNLCFESEPSLSECLTLAQAAKNSGGIVIAQVGKIAKANSLDPWRIRVPGLLVDYLVLAENDYEQKQTPEFLYNPYLCGALKAPDNELPKLELSPKKIIGRRATLELKANSKVNYGIGLPEAAALVAAEEGLSEFLKASLDTGIFGGLPLSGDNFGTVYNPEAFIEPLSLFDFYDGFGLDSCILGLGEIDSLGNVNASRFAGHMPGCGGFINISGAAKKVIFCSYFTAAGFQAEIKNKKLKIITEGKVNKFVKNVGQITFSAKQAFLKKQEVIYITERAVFKLTKDGLLLTEIAPGISLEEDILKKMDFKPQISPTLKEMASFIFAKAKMNLQK